MSPKDKGNAQARWFPLGLLAGSAAAILFVTLDIVDGLLRPDYSILRHWVSHRALGEFGWLGTTSLLATGLLVVANGVALISSGRKATGWSWYPHVILLAGTALLVAAIFPMDPSLGFPTQSVPPAATLSGSIHDIAGPVFMLSLAVGAFLSRRFVGQLRPDAPSLRYGWVVGTAIVVLFVLTSVLVSLDFANVLPSAWSGISERGTIYLGLTWNALVSWRLSAQSRVQSVRATA